jgi:hypothetical protein
VLSLSVPSRHVAFRDPGKSTGCASSFLLAGDAGLRPGGKGSALPQLPFSRLPVRLRCNLSSCSPPFGDFYFWASDGLVTRSAARYDYGVNWTIYTGGTLTRWNVS